MLDSKGSIYWKEEYDKTQNKISELAELIGVKRTKNDKDEIEFLESGLDTAKKHLAFCKTQYYEALAYEEQGVSKKKIYRLGRADYGIYN